MKQAQQQEPRVIWDCKGNKRLELFLSCPAKEILYGGAAGGGKTEGLAIAAIGDNENNIFQNPNWKVLMLRRTFPELENSLIQRSHALFSERGKYDGVKHRWSFTQSGGGLIQYGHIKNNDDVVKYQSAEFSMIIFDELTHFTERMYLYLFSRCRTTDPTITAKVKAASNPGGMGHAWVKNRFIQDSKSRLYYKPFQIYNSYLTVAGIKTHWSKCFIPATVFDNNFLMKNDPMYVRRLYELPEVERKALMYGDWDIFSGQFFTEFSEENVIEPFEIPVDWPIHISLDWGYATQCAVLFFAVDPNTEKTYIFDELYVKKTHPTVVASMIKDKLGKKFMNLVGRYGDKRMMVVNEDTNISTKEIMGMNGLHFTIADSNQQEGWIRAKELMMRDKEKNITFFVFRDCVNFIRTIPEQIYDVRNPERIDEKGETHMADALRYFAISRRASESYTSERDVPVSYSSVTGYVGLREEDSLLRHRIKRLPALKKGINYFIDRA